MTHIFGLLSPNIFTQDNWILSLDTLVSQPGNRSAGVHLRFQSKAVEGTSAGSGFLTSARPWRRAASCQVTYEQPVSSLGAHLWHCVQVTFLMKRVTLS